MVDDANLLKRSQRWYYGQILLSISAGVLIDR